MRQVNFGSGFFRSSDAPWSERSWIGLLSKETQLRFRILSDLRIQSWIFWKKRALSVSHSPHSLSLHYFTEHFRLIKSTGWDVYLHNYSIFFYPKPALLSCDRNETDPLLFAVLGRRESRKIGKVFWHLICIKYCSAYVAKLIPSWKDSSPFFFFF